MSTKHFFTSSPEELVRDALEGLIVQHPDLALDRKQKALFNTFHDPSKTPTLISGGGAGHEPAHAAYVGNGMLSAAVSGNIFASPSVSQISATIKRAGGSAGVLLIVKNYTGDVFHFSLAAEKARATLGFKTEVLVVGDDVAVGRKKSGKVGRRGLAGTVLVHKILGAASENGVALDGLAKLGKKVADNLVTVGASLDHVHLPGQKSDSHIKLAEGEIELGMGIHNEPGSQLLSDTLSLDDLIGKMLKLLLDADDKDRAYVDLTKDSEIVLLVNNLGSVSQLEFAGITSRTVNLLANHGIKPVRVLSGTFMTSLDGPGFSITLLKADSEILGYIDAPTTALGWPSRGSSGTNFEARILKAQEEEHTSSHTKVSRHTINLSSFATAISSACKSAIEAEPSITKSDTIVGDGDCGTTLKRVAEAVLSKFRDAQSQESEDVAKVLLELADIVEENMDGTSGALFAIFFNGLASAVQDLLEPASGTTELQSADWAKLAASALATLQKATPARPGDRTLIDALEPFVNSLPQGLDTAVKEAKVGLESTRGMTPALGRAVYVSEKGWETVPDPGAEGIVALVVGLLKGQS